MPEALAPQTSFYPVAEISPYVKSWTLKVRVVNKTIVREFNRLGGKGGSSNGKVFSVDLLDVHGGEIRASFFNEAVDKFLPQIEKGKCFTMSKGQIKVANRQYSTISNEYEIAFGPEATITEVADDGTIESEFGLNFLDLRDVKQKTGSQFVCDIIGVCTKVEDIRNWSKDGKEYTKYGITLADESENQIDVSVFGKDAVLKYPREKCEIGKVIVFKSCNVKDFSGRSGIIGANGSMVIDTFTGVAKKRADELTRWWSNGGSTKNFLNMTEPIIGGGQRVLQTVTIDDLKEVVQESLPDPPITNDIYVRLAKVLMTKQGTDIPQFYEACPVKVTRDGIERICNKKCDGQICPEHGNVIARKRWLARTIFEDHTDGMLLQSFDTEFTTISGKTAEEAYSAGKMDEWIDSLSFMNQYKLRIRTAQDSYNGETRAVTRIVEANKVNFVERGHELLRSITEIAC